jgi:hypothetical protein
MDGRSNALGGIGIGGILLILAIAVLFSSNRRWISLRVSTRGLRTIEKNGIDSVLAKLRAAGDKR